MRIYYGWSIVAIALVANMIFNGLTFQAFTLFVLPVSKEYGLSRADMNSAMALLSLGQAIAAPFIGRLIDYVSARKALIFSALLLGVCLVTLGLTHSVLLSAMLFLLPIPVALLCTPLITIPLLINRWFVVRRGQAMLLAALGTSLGFVVVAPLVGLLIDRLGWRDCLLVLGAASSTLLLILALLVRDRPGPGVREAAEGSCAAPASVRIGDQGRLRVATLLATPQLWLLGVAIALATASATSLMISFVPVASAEGISALRATGLISISGLGALAAKVLLSTMADRFDRIAVLAGIVALGALANLLLLVTAGYAALVICAVILGVAIGTLAPLASAVIADWFGAASFGAVSGLLLVLSAGCAAAGHRFAGEVFDRTGDYRGVFVTYVVLDLVAALMIGSLRFAGGTAQRGDRRRRAGASASG